MATGIRSATLGHVRGHRPALEREADPDASVGGYNFYYNIIDGFEDFGAGKADSIKGLETPTTARWW